MLSMSMVNVMMGCREESDLDDKAGVHDAVLGRCRQQEARWGDTDDALNTSIENTMRACQGKAIVRVEKFLSGQTTHRTKLCVHPVMWVA